MFEHIAVFVDRMHQKGYHKMFQSSSGFCDNLKNSLSKHVFQCYEEKQSIAPLVLTTYSLWNDSKSPYVRCNFYTNFSDLNGFQVHKMNIEYGNEYGIIREKVIPVNSNSQIPSREEANQMITDRRKRLKLKGL